MCTAATEGEDSDAGAGGSKAKWRVARDAGRSGRVGGCGVSSSRGGVEGALLPFAAAGSTE
eukprot:1057071-Prymnesium_polylepis.1